MDVKERRQAFGLTQLEVAESAGLHQPDLSAIENGRSARPATISRIERALIQLVRPSRLLTLYREEILRVLHEEGLENVRVFGSCLHGTDRPGSDIDLLVDMPGGGGLFRLLPVESDVSELVGVRVDLLVDDPDNPALDRVRSEAVRL